MVCSKCGKSVDGNAVFCSYCGNKLRPPMPEVPETECFLVCPGCNTKFPSGQVFCDKCGTKLVSPQQHIEGQDQNDVPDGPKINYRVSILCGIIIAIVAIFLVLWTNGEIDW